MSHNTEPGRAARRHPAPIIAIAAALIVAAVAGWLFLGADPDKADDVNRVESPAAAPQIEAPATSPAPEPAPQN